MADVIPSLAASLRQVVECLEKTPGHLPSKVSKDFLYIFKESVAKEPGYPVKECGQYLINYAVMAHQHHLVLKPYLRGSWLWLPVYGDSKDLDTFYSHMREYIKNQEKNNQDLIYKYSVRRSQFYLDGQIRRGKVITSNSLPGETHTLLEQVNEKNTFVL